MKSLNTIIKLSIEEAQKDFKNNPYDCAGSEANARSKLYVILQKNIEGNIII